MRRRRVRRSHEEWVELVSIWEESGSSARDFCRYQGVSESTWNPDLERSERAPRDLLNEKKPFDWQLESIGWKEAGERQILFHVVLSLCFRFVVLHEVGHIENDHGRRRVRTGDNLLLVDRPSPGLLQPEEASELKALFS